MFTQNFIDFLVMEAEKLSHWRREIEEKMSKLSDAVTGLQLAVSDLKTRSQNENAALQKALDAANADASDAADKLAQITSDITGVDVPPASGDTSSSSSSSEDTSGGVSTGQ
jgi:predicted  nucleic acid-binding Zn-ribbon protein